MTKRIVVECGSSSCKNMGDLAMTKVAVSRLSALWPHASMEVLTARPDLLPRFFPSAVPIDTKDRGAWITGRSLLGRYGQMLPGRLSAFVKWLEEQIWLRYPRLSELGVNLRARVLRKPVPDSPAAFRKRLTGADLMVVSGMGAINDAFSDLASVLLDELEAVYYAGVPVVAFGQGIGPITDPQLLAKARAVLPQLKLICLREGNRSLPLLESLGVSRDRIRVTGDDAIELAYALRPESLGDRIGVNIRLAGYAGTSGNTLETLREPVLRAAQSLNSGFLSVPISFQQGWDSDVEAVEKLLGPQLGGPQVTDESPEAVAQQIGRCRVVITGSYHGAVFALSQGIPVVCLLESDYYQQKFLGLHAQFPGGCRIIDLRHLVSIDAIFDAICDAWKSAERTREPLLRAAAEQIELGHAAYRTVQDLVPLEA